MITLGPVRNIEKTKKLFEERNIPWCGDSDCVAAMNGDEVLGLCLYNLDKEKMTVLHIEPLEDVALADGILRSTLHVAAERNIMKAFYGDTVPEDFLRKIAFIKNTQEKTLDMDKLFKSCCDCK